jgi:hypothetical protein
MPEPPREWVKDRLDERRRMSKEPRIQRAPPKQTVEAWTGESKRQPEPEPNHQPIHSITIHISGSVSQLNTVVETVQNIESRLTAISTEGQPHLARALQDLVQAVLDDPSLDEQRRQELIEAVDDLSEQARLPPEQRK